MVGRRGRRAVRSAVDRAGDRATAVAAGGAYRQRLEQLGERRQIRRAWCREGVGAGGGARAVEDEAPAGEAGAGGRRFGEDDLVTVVDRRRTCAVRFDVY